MSNTIKFSDLASGTPAATDIYPFVPSGGASAKKVTFTALASAVLALNAGAVTADAPVLNLAQTWNNGAVTFTGLKFSVTDSGSGAASLLLDLQVGASSKFKIDKAGVEPTLTFRWQERGGPRVIAPTHKSFGTTLIERAIGAVKTPPRIDYAPEGLTYEFSVPLAAVAADVPFITPRDTFERARNASR